MVRTSPGASQARTGESAPGAPRRFKDFSAVTVQAGCVGVWLGEGIGLGGVVGMAALVVAQARTSRGRVNRMIIFWVFTYATILSGMRGRLTAYSLPGLWTPFARGESCCFVGYAMLGRFCFAVFWRSV